MTAPPLNPKDVTDVDVLLISHHHGDHCHVESISGILSGSGNASVLTTRSSSDLLVSAGLDASRITVPEFPGRQIEGGVRTFVVPARHYEFSYREDTVFDYFGFVFELDGHRIYSSGDTIPFVGQAALLRQLGVDIALLPVNGRDPERDAMGIIGNMTVEESATLVNASGCRWVVPCHFGMFAANTVDPDYVEDVMTRGCQGATVMMPVVGQTMELP